MHGRESRVQSVVWLKQRKEQAIGWACHRSVFIFPSHGEQKGLRRLFCLKEHGTRPHLSHHRAKLSHAGSQLPYPGASDQPLHHCYFYIWDQVLGPILIRVASFFPFLATNWLNGTLS